MEIMIGERRIEVPQEEADRLMERYAQQRNQLRLGDQYWIVWPAGTVSSSTWTNDPDDSRRSEMGNMFLTEEDAQAYRDWLKAVAEIRQSSDFVPDWESTGQSKYFVYYDHNEQKLCVEYFDYFQNQSIVHYETIDEAESAIENHREAYLTYFGISKGKERA